LILNLIVARPLRVEYPGAIYHVTSRGRERLDILEEDHDRKRLEARKAYRRFVRRGIKAPSPWDALKARCIPGGEAFIEKLKTALERQVQAHGDPKKLGF
jgi:hypothetical protein